MQFTLYTVSGVSELPCLRLSLVSVEPQYSGASLCSRLVIRWRYIIMTWPPKVRLAVLAEQRYSQHVGP
jgi:hypothetical protein